MAGKETPLCVRQARARPLFCDPDRPTFRLRSGLVLSGLTPVSIHHGYRAALSGVACSEVVCVQQGSTEPAAADQPLEARAAVLQVSWHRSRVSGRFTVVTGGDR